MTVDGTALPHELKWLEACTLLAPLFSTCSRRQYFAVVLAPNRRVAGIGYNGAPPGMVHCTDGGCPRATSTVTPGTGYDDPAGFCVAQHAEAGALLWSDPAVRNGGTLVVNGPPCLECARLVASAGIKRVVHTMNDDYPGWPAVARFLGHAGVDVVGCPAPAGDMIVVTDSTGTELSRIEGEDATRVIEAGVRLLVTEAMRWPR